MSVPRWATCDLCHSFRPRSEMKRDPRRLRRWTCKTCPTMEATDG